MRRIIIYVLIIACFFSMTACGRSEDIQDVIANKTFVYEKEGFGGKFTIKINDDGRFSYYEGGFSSYIGIGSWVLEDDILILSDDDDMGYPFVNRFKVKDGDLVFISQDSSNFLYVKVADGERFVSVSDGADIPSGKIGTAAADTDSSAKSDEAITTVSETEADSISPAEQEEEEAQAVSAELLPSPDEDFVIFNGYYYLNISDNPEFSDYEYYIGDYFGQVSSNVTEDNISLDNDGLASVLPIGTDLYKYPDYPAIILADADGTLIPYLKMVEG